MSLKKISCLFVTLLLLAGMTSVANAATPAGVRLRIEHPDNDAWAGIGDSVVVAVQFLPGTAALDSVWVAITEDTSATDVSTLTASGSADLTNDGNDDFVKKFADGDASSADSDGFKSFTASFLVTAGQTVASSSKSLSLTALVSTDDGSTFNALNNQNTDQTIDGDSGFGNVGDAVLIGIDAERPTANIDSVRLDTTGVSDFPNDGGGPAADGNNASLNPKKAFKTGTQVKVSFFVQNVPSGASGIVHITDTSNVSNLPDSAMKTVTFAFSKLVSGSASDSTSVTLAAGDITGDNKRIVAVAFLQDAAGNLSSTTSTDVSATGVTDVNMHVLDVNSPTITPLSPKSGATDSTYFTGVVDTSLNIVPKAGGAAAGITFAASPLKFTTDEGAKFVTAEFKSDIDTLAITQLASGGTGSFATNFGITDQAGKTDDLTISVTDSVGNKTDSEQADVTYDQVVPGAVANSVFPTRTDAPPDVDNSNEPTVNRDTMMPILQLLEATDSLAVQYVEVTSGTAKNAKQELAPGDPDLAITDAEIQIIFVDTLFSNRDYTLQMVFRDMAGNHQATAPDTLTFDADFQNPVADSFVVVADGGDSIVIAAQALTLEITGIDTALTNSSGSQRAAVTHSGEATLRIDAGEQDVSGISFSGDGVTDNEDGTATLASDDWSLGDRKVTIKSTKTLTAFNAIVEDKTGDDVNFSGTVGNLQVDAGNFSTYNVWVVEDADGGDSAAGVSGNFKVMVQPADRFGNASSKTFANDPALPIRQDSTDLTDAEVDSQYVLGEVFATFSSNRGDVGVPQGPQAISEGGSMFAVGGASESGDDLLISVSSVATGNDTLGIAPAGNTDHDRARGSVTLAFAPEGETVVVEGDLAAPANLLVQDWMGSDGAGDQGGFVSVAFPAASGAARYRIFREMTVTTALDADGNVVEGDTSAAWVSWTVVDNIAGDDVQRAVVPTLDNIATNWAVASEAGGSSSERTASKRVFTKQLVQNMVQFLGVDPNRVLSMTELEQVFTPSDDYVKSIIGDREDMRYAVIDPDFASMIAGSSTVPQNIRTQAGGVKTSARTATETPVKSVDNIAPAAITELAGAVEGSSVTLTWTASADDKVVAYSSYKGYAVPIAGVDRYDIYRGTSEEDLAIVGSVPGGVTTFTESGLEGLSSVIYRVDASDLDNATPAVALDVPLGGRIIATDADGNSVYLVTDEDFTVNFADFISFAGSFNRSTGEAGFVANADTDDSGLVDFTDFLNFAGSFNKTATTINGSPVGNTKPVIRTLRPGVNDNVELSLNLTSDKVLAGQTVTVNVTVDNAASMQGLGFDVTYDTDKFEFVEATPAQEDLLKSGGAETPVFLHQEASPGEITVANAVVDGSPVTGAGDVVSLTFRVLSEFQDNAHFEIANGVVFDGTQLSNPVVALGSLSVESTPTEFALLQNFPNPFNPETTIKYNVASGSNVSLRIYNVVGQVVRTLVAEQQNAGRYTVRWNGSDDRGVSVSSGIYFYQISAGDFSDVKKLMLLK